MKNSLRIEPGNKLPNKVWTKYSLAPGWLSQGKSLTLSVKLGGDLELDSLVYLVGVSFQFWPSLFPFLPPSQSKAFGIAYMTLNPERIQVLGYVYRNGTLTTHHLGFALYGDELTVSMSFVNNTPYWECRNKSAKKWYEAKSDIEFLNAKPAWLIKPHRAVKSDKLVTIDFYSSI